MDVTELLKVYGPGVAWVVAVIGWAITNRHANQREKRKEVRSEIEAIEEAVLKIAETMSEYLRSNTVDVSAKLKELEVIVLFQSVDRRIERLKKRQSGGTLGLYIDLVDREREEFYDYTTGAYFQTPVRLIEPDLSERITEIHSRAQILVEALHSYFLMKFDKIRSTDL